VVLSFPSESLISAIWYNWVNTSGNVHWVPLIIVSLSFKSKNVGNPETSSIGVCPKWVSNTFILKSVMNLLQNAVLPIPGAPLQYGIATSFNTPGVICMFNNPTVGSKTWCNGLDFNSKSIAIFSPWDLLYNNVISNKKLLNAYLLYLYETVFISNYIIS